MDKYLNKTEKEIESMLDVKFSFKINLSDLFNLKKVWGKIKKKNKTLNL